MFALFNLQGTHCTLSSRCELHYLITFKKLCQELFSSFSKFFKLLRTFKFFSLLSDKLWYCITAHSLCQELFSLFWKVFQSRVLSSCDSLNRLSYLSRLVKLFLRIFLNFFQNRFISFPLVESLVSISNQFPFVNTFFQLFSESGKTRHPAPQPEWSGRLLRGSTSNIDIENS